MPCSDVLPSWLRVNMDGLHCPVGGLNTWCAQTDLGAFLRLRLLHAPQACRMAHSLRVTGGFPRYGGSLPTAHSCACPGDIHLVALVRRKSLSSGNSFREFSGCGRWLSESWLQTSVWLLARLSSDGRWPYHPACHVGNPNILAEQIFLPLSVSACSPL
jgi:hypothetical protein